MTTFLKKYTVYSGIALVLLISTVVISNSSSRVTISSDSWECTSADTIGIHARCTSYRIRTLPGLRTQ